ncbi:MAG: hypothetical protein ACYTAF_02920 [Planctomycetota bacterium]|jgi:hypothetical protein
MSGSTRIMFAVLGVFAILHVLTFLKLAEVRGAGGTERPAAPAAPAATPLPEKAYTDTAVLAAEVERLRAEVDRLRSAPQENPPALPRGDNTVMARPGFTLGASVPYRFPTHDPEVGALLSRLRAPDHLEMVLAELYEAFEDRKIDAAALREYALREIAAFAGIEPESTGPFRKELVRAVERMTEARKTYEAKRPRNPGGWRNQETDPFWQAYRKQLNDIIAPIDRFLGRCPDRERFLEMAKDDWFDCLVEDDGKRK